MMRIDTLTPEQVGPRKSNLCQGIYDRWYTVRCALYGLRITWVSAASLIVGALLFRAAPQVQDLFMEATGNAFASIGYWLTFYIAVMTLWCLPVYVSSSWILSRFEKRASAMIDPEIKPVKPWVRQYLPPLLAVACFGAVLLGQVMALSNAPEPPTNGFMSYYGIEAAKQNAAYAISAAAHTAACTGSDEAGCLIAKARQVGQTALAISNYEVEVLTIGLGSDQVILVIYGILAIVVIWFWLRRWVTSWPFKNGRIWAKVIWWLITLALTLPLLAVLFVATNFATQEWSKDLSLGHMVLLPGLTALAAYLAWMGLKPNPGGGVTVIGRLISYAFRIDGIVDQTTATERVVQPLYFFVAIGSVSVFLTPLVLHPVDITTAFLHRASLLPLLLGVLVAPFTYVSYWSVRCQAPLVLAVVLVISGTTILFGDSSDIRTIVLQQQKESYKRESLQQEIQRWAVLNGCKVDTQDDARACPNPFIILAAGGASRSAFHVAGVIGKLMDEVTQTFDYESIDDEVASSADGTRIVANFGDHARIWDTATGNEIKVLRAPGLNIKSSALSPDGSRVVTVLLDDTARIWDVSTGNEIKVIGGHNREITSAAFTPDGGTS
jgi:hypothetical protein